jgi:phosphatidate cytidylyltransferase
MKRILTATVLIVGVVALVLYGAPWMVTVFAGIVAALAAYEYIQLTAAGGSPVPLWWMAAAVVLFFLVVNYQPQDTIAAVSLATLVLFAWSAFKTPLYRVLGETAAGLFALLYICYPLTLLPQMLAKWDGPALLLFLFVCVWSGDIAALYIGKRFGRRKLAPHLSPNKTWEGAIASVVASAVFGMALVGAGEYLSRTGSSFTRLHTSEPWWQSLILAIILNVAAQLGDLLESALKRGVNVKDSGTMLPGHGGILDRIDALLLAAPVLWFVLALKEYYSFGIF